MSSRYFTFSLPDVDSNSSLFVIRASDWIHRFVARVVVHGSAMNISLSLIGTSFRTSRVDSFSQVRGTSDREPEETWYKIKKGGVFSGKGGGL